MSDRNILIIGGGIGGLAAAIAPRRAGDVAAIEMTSRAVRAQP